MPTPSDCYIDLRGLPFHYRDWGGTGRPVLLLHGLASTCHIWDLVAPLLAEEFRVVALDQRGHGLSAQVEDGYDFATVSGDAAAFIKSWDGSGPSSPATRGAPTSRWSWRCRRTWRGLRHHIRRRGHH